MKKTKILFVCIHNSARSQMAEAFVNRYCSECFEAESAGLEPGNLNPIVIEAMAEDGIDISQNATKSVDEILRAGKTYDYVVTVCDEASAERCPIFPGRPATCAMPSPRRWPRGARKPPASATRRAEAAPAARKLASIGAVMPELPAEGQNLISPICSRCRAVVNGTSVC